jgi:3-oxoacyl-[acyl-carrier protein] reductase
MNNKNIHYDFSDQVVIVTGGTSGIGKSIVEHFLRAQATVVSTYAHNHQRAESCREEFNTRYPEFKNKLLILQSDNSQEKDVTDLFSMIEERFGRLDVLVNNAGTRQDSALGMMSLDQFEGVLKTNLTGTFLMCQKSLYLFLKNRYGRIINITSVGGRLSLAGQCNYGASKAGIESLTKTLSKEVGKKNITVNCLSPGFIETDFIGDLSEEQKKSYQQIIPLKRMGKVEEVSQAVLFLASGESSYITGTTLEVGGGL